MPNPPARLRIGTVTVEQASLALADSLNKWFEGYGPEAIFKSCANCRHMSEQGPAFCSKFKATPPASVIVVGCPEHDDKEAVPF